MRLAGLSLHNLLRLQVLCLGLAIVVGSFFWAIGQPVNFDTVLLYSLLLGNLIMPATSSLRPLYENRPFPYDWLVFTLIVLLLLGPVYVIASIFVWRLAPPTPQTLSHLLRTGWKLPAVITFLFSMLTDFYRRTQGRLVARNRELQQSIDRGAAELEVQEEELRRAREIQQSLLPREIPQLAGFEVAAAWRPARTVSGDYYDAFRLERNRLGICIADVAGKGVSAALLMANVQAAVHAFASSAESPAQLCSKVNKQLCENLATGKFVTFLYGVLDSEARTFRYCNGGHVYPILISAGVSQILENGGAALGVFPTWVYEDAVIEFRPGDRLLLVTDGITEASGPDEQEYGEERLAAVAQTHRNLSAAAMNDLLLQQAAWFCGSQFQDDATLMVIAAK